MRAIAEILPYIDGGFELKQVEIADWRVQRVP